LPLVTLSASGVFKQALYDLQVNSEKLKGPLREVHITAAKEIDLGAGKQCIVIFVPVPMLAQFQKIIKERSLIEELEKKFSGQPILIIAERKIMRRESRGTRQLKQLRPRKYVIFCAKAAGRLCRLFLPISCFCLLLLVRSVS
jgi:hypothetical protein